ncbi:MAG: redoxin domain-containing protein, partial [Myxococcota bacterium]
MIWLALGCTRPPVAADRGFEVGDRVPNARLRDTDDRPVRLYALTGDVTVLAFSAMWCAPCRDLPAVTD